MQTSITQSVKPVSLLAWNALSQQLIVRDVQEVNYSILEIVVQHVLSVRISQMLLHVLLALFLA